MKALLKGMTIGAALVAAYSTINPADAQTAPEFNGPHELVSVTTNGYAPVTFQHVGTFDTPYACEFAALRLHDEAIRPSYFSNAASSVKLVCIPVAVPATCVPSPGQCYTARMPAITVE